MSDRWAVVLALCTAVGAWVAGTFGWPGGGALPLGLALASASFVVRRPAVLCLGAVLLSGGLCQRAVAGLDPPAPAPFSGVVTLLSDPEPVFGATRVEVRIAGRRHEGWARGPAAWALERRLAGERVALTGTVRPLPDDVAVRLGRRHIVGRLSITDVGEWAGGAWPARVANGLRRTLGTGAASLPEERRSLFTGVVIGDDRGQGAGIADDFRAAGLTHLLAVSGQNVAFVLAVCAPILSRLGLRGRFLAVLAVIGLFGLVTRWEPSVMRAAAMAAVATTAATLGREASGARRLALAVTAVVLIDPFLVWSIGFLLSVGASAGILLLAAPIERRLPGPRWLTTAAAVTAAAQVGVAPVLVPVFGGLPLATLPANLLAAPAAGPLMMWGLTAGLVAGLAGGWLATVLHLPTQVLLWWLAAVARWSAGLALGSLGVGHVAPLAALGLAAFVLTRRRPMVAWPRRWLAAATVAVVLSPLLARPPTVPPGGEVVEGARLWRAGGAAVLVLDGASPTRLLEALRAARVRAVDVVALVRPGPAAADAAAPVLERLRPRLVLGPAGHARRGAVTPEVGARLAVGGLELVVVDVDPQLVVEVSARSRGPPGAGVRSTGCSCASASAPTTSPPGRWSWASSTAPPTRSTTGVRSGTSTRS